MIRFARILAEDVRQSGMDTGQYAENWGINRRTLNHWMSGSRPTEKYLAKIGERFLQSDLFDEEIASSATWDSGQTKIMLARMKVTEFTFFLEWLVNSTPEVRKKFREEAGSEWEHFVNLTRALINEKTLEVARSEGRLSQRRS